MSISILHAEPFRYSGYNLVSRYISSPWGGIVNGFGFGDGSVARPQAGRGSAPQGWCLRGDGAPNNNVFGVQTSSLYRPRAPQAGNFAECFAFSCGGHGDETLLAEYGEEDGSKLHLQIKRTSAGHITATNGDGDVIGTSTYVMPLGSGGSAPNYTHLEIIPYLAASGWVMVKADGVLVLDVLGKTSKGIGTPSLGIAQRPIQIGRFFTDWAIHNAGGHGSTKASAEWLGDVRVTLQAPTVASTYTAGTAVNAASRLLAVNDLEHTRDINGTYADDDTYVSLDDTGLPKALSFTCAALPANAKTVFSVFPWGLLRKDDAGTNTGRLLLISDTTETDGTEDLVTDITPQTGYGPYARPKDADPATTAAWLVAACDAAKIGYRRIS